MKGVREEGKVDDVDVEEVGSERAECGVCTMRGLVNVSSYGMIDRKSAEEGCVAMSCSSKVTSRMTEAVGATTSPGKCSPICVRMVRLIQDQAGESRAMNNGDEPSDLLLLLHRLDT